MDITYILVGAGSAAAALATVGTVMWAINRKGRSSTPSPVREAVRPDPYIEPHPVPEVRPEPEFVPATPQIPAVSESELRARLAAASNFEECLVVHRLAEEGSTLEREAIEKFNRTARTELAALISIPSCWRFYDELPTERIGESRVIATEVLEKMLSLVTDSEEVKELHDEYVGRCEDDQFAARLRTRYNELARNELAALTTVEKCLEFLTALPDDDFADVDSISDEVIEKAIVLASTHVEARTLFDSYIEDYEGEEMLAKISARLAALLRVRLGELTTVDECLRFLSDSVPDDESFTEFDALVLETREKILLLATTVDEVSDLYDELDGDVDEELCDRALARALELATTVDDASWVLDNTSEDSELEQAAMSKWLSLVTAVTECESVWTNYGIDSNLGKMAILRAAEIIRGEQDASKA